MKAAKMLSIGEPLGHFMAPVLACAASGASRSGRAPWPMWRGEGSSTATRLLGILDEAGHPFSEMGVLAQPSSGRRG